MRDFTSRPGEPIQVSDINAVSTIDSFVIAEVWKTGEKPMRRYRGRKPQGYIVYRNGAFDQFLPYGDKPKFIVKEDV